ncbi:hypothetical protein [Fibrivirga algicola]|uniref:Uncharacterized protein n=1 Tax=Fibrivirga algicola TaxID=2950420 RepID=A0ABX0QEF3_9BACT|nr:hypothetical protein [Fibrivirga algicola]ARK09658.1 hypothetical protein A6C57_04540 [Fibrella sp. ES10-3-2-2]NID10546.1 hypothetical protein [Fibrivirga algicola]
MATQSPFDPDNVDPEFYSQNPNQQAKSDYGHESEGVGTNTYKDSTSGQDMASENRDYVAGTRAETFTDNNPDAPRGESVGTYQEWDVDPALLNPDKEVKGLTEAEAKHLESLPDNPSDEALFHRGDATYLEQGDDPTRQYDPHNKGYDDKAGKEQ